MKTLLLLLPLLLLTACGTTVIQQIEYNNYTNTTNSGNLTGSGTDTRFAIFTGGSTIGYSNLAYDDSTNTLHTNNEEVIISTTPTGTTPYSYISLTTSKFIMGYINEAMMIPNTLTINETGTVLDGATNCLVFNDDTTQCTAASGSGAGNVTGSGRNWSVAYWTNETNLDYLNCTANQYVRSNSSGQLYCAAVVTDTDTNTPTETFSFGSTTKVTANNTPSFLTFGGVTMSATLGLNTSTRLSCTYLKYSWTVATYTTPSVLNISFYINGAWAGSATTSSQTNGDYAKYETSLMRGGTPFVWNKDERLSVAFNKMNGSQQITNVMVHLYCLRA